MSLTEAKNLQPFPNRSINPSKEILVKKTLKTTLLTAAFAALGAISVPTASTLGSLGLAVAGLSWAGGAMASGIKPIGGIGVRICKNPNGSARCATATTDPKGAFTFTALEAGEYDVTVGNGTPIQMKVGKDGFMKGVLESDGKTGGVQFENEKGIKVNAIKGCGKCGVTAG